MVLPGKVRETEMEMIIGHKLPSKLNKIADLLYYDGPLVSVFEDDEATYHLCCWCDADEKYNRWLLFENTGEEIGSYVKGKLSLHEIMMRADSFFLCDMNTDIEYENIYFVKQEQLPESYIPSHDSFFDSDLDGISEQDLFILNKRFVSDSTETMKQTSNIVPFASIKTSDLAIPSHTTNSETEVRNVA
jgi:hypothetical protein